MGIGRMKRKTRLENYLVYLPAHSETCHYDIDDEGDVTIYVENKGIFHWIARKLFHRPRISQIHLDEMGNFLWPFMDGSRTVCELGELVREEFGDKAEPLYSRLVQYVRNLESYGFVKVEPKANLGRHISLPPLF